MAKHIWSQEAKCKSCGGTGVHKGIGEHGRAGIVCADCKGSGKIIISIKWEDFKGRVERKDIDRVFEINPGIVVSGDSKHGGMTYKDWLKGNKFILGTENRKFCCPAWWYQLVDYALRPKWKECMIAGSIRGCVHFKNKEKCWQRWDKEFGRKRIEKILKGEGKLELKIAKEIYKEFIEEGIYRKDK